MLTVALSRQPPLQIRTGMRIPPFSVIVNLTESASLAADPANELGPLHALVSLWSADGQVSCPHMVPPFLAGHKNATLAVSNGPNGIAWRYKAAFTDLAITQSGHYMIRISILDTSMHEDEGGERVLGSPRVLLRLDTRPIHVHGFAPLSRALR